MHHPHEVRSNTDHRIGASPRSKLLLTQLPQLIHTRCPSRYHSLCDLYAPTNRTLSNYRIRRCLRRDLDDANSRIFRTAIVLSVAEIAEPRFEGGRVVLFDDRAVGDDVCLAGHGSPLTGAVEEGDVDVRIRVDVVGLAGFGVGVEDQINTASFLQGKLLAN